MQRKNKIKIISFIIISLILTGLPFSFSQAKKIKPLTTAAVPNIYPRSAWSNAVYDKRTKKMWPAEFENPKVIIVHHTATSYTGATSRQIKKIYKYHSYTKKWGDIGYNYIIGKDGSIFEGRYGGNGVVGGHAYYKGTNYNRGSIGISVIGNYQNEKMSPEALDSLQKLIGWLAANNNVAINSEIKFFDKKLKSAVIGHEDVASTACPGKNIYNNLGSIRTASASLADSYKNFAYKYGADGAAFEIANGERYSGSVKQLVIELASTQLEAYPLSGTAKSSVNNAVSIYPSGTLFSVSASGQRGVLENNNIRPINSAAVLSANYSSSDFVEMTQDRWNSYVTGSAENFRSGAFLRDDAGIYYIINSGQKRLLDLPEAEKKNVDYSRVVATPSSELAGYSDGANIASMSDLPEGTIITPNNRNYFVIQANKTKKSISKSVFGAGFAQTMTMKVSQKLSKTYKTRKNLALQDGAVVKYQNRHFFIENGLRRQFATKSLAASMGYKNIVKAGKSDFKGIGIGAKIE